MLEYCGDTRYFTRAHSLFFERTVASFLGYFCGKYVSTVTIATVAVETSENCSKSVTARLILGYGEDNFRL